MDMERTQIYLPRALKRELHRQAARSGANMSELLRAAATRYLNEQERAPQAEETKFSKALARALGMWKHRNSSEFLDIRRSADRKAATWSG